MTDWIRKWFSPSEADIACTRKSPEDDYSIHVVEDVEIISSPYDDVIKVEENETYVSLNTEKDDRSEEVDDLLHDIFSNSKLGESELEQPTKPTNYMDMDRYDNENEIILLCGTVENDEQKAVNFRINQMETELNEASLENPDNDIITATNYNDPTTRAFETTHNSCTIISDEFQAEAKDEHCSEGAQRRKNEQNISDTTTLDGIPRQRKWEKRESPSNFQPKDSKIIHHKKQQAAMAATSHASRNKSSSPRINISHGHALVLGCSSASDNDRRRPPVELHVPIRIRLRTILSLMVISLLVAVYTFTCLDENHARYPLCLLGSLILAFIAIMLTAIKKCQGPPKPQMIKWTVENFSNEIQHGIITSPSFKTLSGCGCQFCRNVLEWRLTVQRDRSLNDQKYRFGLIIHTLPEEVQAIRLKIAFSALDHNGVHLTSSNIVAHTYTTAGDCAYSDPLAFDSSEDSKMISSLFVRCNVTCDLYQQKTPEIFRDLCELLEMKFFDENAERMQNEEQQRNGAEYGILTLEPKNNDDDNLKINCSPNTQAIGQFIRECETQTFLWTIPNFKKMLRDDEFWGVFSPKLYVLSHGVCSIWSLKLFEFQGVFRLHVQLRGLPSGTKRIKMNYLIQLQDNYGDFVVPEECGRRLRSGEFVKLWDNSRHALYSRTTLLERFITDENTLRIRLSLNLEPFETELEPNSRGWVMFD